MEWSVVMVLSSRGACAFYVFGVDRRRPDCLLPFDGGAEEDRTLLEPVALLVASPRATSPAP
jgi:hypothetical protein